MGSLPSDRQFRASSAIGLIRGPHPKAAAPDYIGVGPIFPTPTKATPDPVLGLARAAAVVATSPLTCVGIGGIDAERLPCVLGAGIENFAVVRYVCASDRPADRIRELRWRPPGAPTADAGRWNRR